MNMARFVKLIPVVGMACLISLPALAQSATSGTMTPVTTSTTKAKTHKHEHKKHEHKAKDDDKKAAASEQDTTRHEAKEKGKKASALPAAAQFSSLSEANAHCGAANVEWATMGGSKIYHDSKSRYFGKTKHGVYACKSTLDADGFRAGK